MLDLVTLGRLVAEKRRTLSLSQQALAQKARVSRATLDALENQRIGELGYSRITRILAALGLELKLQDALTRRPTLDEIRQESRDD